MLMKKIYVIFVIILLGFPIVSAASSLKTYNAPEGATLNDKFKVFVKLID